MQNSTCANQDCCEAKNTVPDSPSTPQLLISSFFNMRRMTFKYVTFFILIFVMYSCGVSSISIKCQVSCFAIMLARQLRFYILHGCRCHCNVSQKERTNSQTLSIDINHYIPGLFELSLFHLFSLLGVFLVAITLFTLLETTRDMYMKQSCYRSSFYFIY